MSAQGEQERLRMAQEHRAQLILLSDAVFYLGLLVACGADFALSQAASSFSVQYDLQDQRPPVARVGDSWTFQFLNDTFAPADSISSYQASGLPDWASFDQDTREFSGTPQEGDLGDTTVTVTAQSSSGSSAANSFDLLVADGSEPTVNIPLADQMVNASSLEPDCVREVDGALRVPPHWSFSIGFRWDTFTNEVEDFPIYYTAFEKDTTELPSWLDYDNTTYAFDGVAPDSGKFDIVLTGSNHFGYGDVSQEFTILVDQHLFDLLEPLPSLNATAGGQVNYTIPIDNLRIDYMEVTDSNITISDIDLSGYPSLNFTQEGRLISGTFPDDMDDDEDAPAISVVIESSYQETIRTEISVHQVSSLFSAASLPDLKLPYDKDFSKDLSDYLTDDDAEYSASISPSSASEWLNFDSSKKMLSGKAPKQGDSSKRKRADQEDAAKVSFTAYDPDLDVYDSASLPVTLSNGADKIQEDPSSGGLSRRAKLALITVFSILGAVLLAVAAWFIYKRCCAPAKKQRHRNPPTIISPPHEPSFAVVFPPGTPDTMDKSFEDGAVIVEKEEHPYHQQQQQQQHFGHQQRPQSLQVEEVSEPRRWDPLGLGFSEPAGTTYERDQSSGPSSGHNQSAWGSQGSTDTWRSLFYSDASGSGHSEESQHRRQGSAQNKIRGSLTRNTSSKSSSSSSSWFQGGIRYISGVAQSPMSSTKRANHDAHGAKPRFARPTLVPLSEVSEVQQSPIPDSAPATPSLVPASPIPTGTSPQLTSQPLLRNDSERFADADEPSYPDLRRAYPGAI